MKVWDISRTLSNDLAEWPGDEPCRFRLTREKAKGASVNLGAISMSVHNGTHADARLHFDSDGESVEKAPLETYLGRATVVESLDLSDVGHGIYHLAALPLKIAGGDGAPMRAILWRE